MVGKTVDNVKLRAWVSSNGFRLESVYMSADWGVPVSTCRFAEWECPSP